MKALLASVAMLGALAATAPAFAQAETVTCGDYSVMDNARQMETLAALDAETSQMAKEESLDADAIHAKLAAECKDKVDVLVIDVLSGK